MTEIEKDEATSANDIADADFSEADKEPSVDEPAAYQPAANPKRGFTASIAWLALFLALISFAAAGYTLVKGLRSAPEVDETAARIDALNARIGALDDLLASQRGDIDALGSADNGLNSSIRSLRGDLNERASLFDSLPPRMSSLERSVASLQGVSIETRNTYLIAEAEYYLQIANAQLQLAGNPYLASLALEQADDRLVQLGDPALTDVRRAISDERAALEVMERPDLAGATLTLGSLAQAVDSLPLRPIEEPSDPQAATDGEDGEEPGGFRRAWNSVTSSFEGAIEITPPSEDLPAILLLEAEPLIRSNLSLQLQAARLALLRGEQQIFEISLDDADVWIETYFDVDNSQVERVRQTLAAIRVDYSAVAPPDISTSLRLLRQYKLLSESATPRPAASRPAVSRPAVSVANAPRPTVSEPRVSENNVSENPGGSENPSVSESNVSESDVSDNESSETEMPETAVPEAEEPEPAVAENGEPEVTEPD